MALDPVIGALFSAGASIAKPAQPAGPSISGATGPVLGFDNSGWTVATHGSTASARSGDRGGLTGTIGIPDAPQFRAAVQPNPYYYGGAGGDPFPIGDTGGASLSISPAYLGLAAVALVVVILLKRK